MKPKPQSLAGRREAHQAAMAAVEPKEDGIILSVKLKSGGFESSLEVPVSATEDERDRFVMAWLKLMEAGLAVAQAK